MKEPASIWEEVETSWPVSYGTGRKSYDEIKEKMEQFLNVREVYPQAFGHFGLVVNDIEDSIRVLEMSGRWSPEGLKTDWVEAYGVYVARCTFEGKELEFIAPRGKSFFDTFLKAEGEGLHHAAFRANDILSCLRQLKMRGVEAMNEEPRSGSHGIVAFIMPGLFDKMCIELYQKNE